MMQRELAWEKEMLDAGKTQYLTNITKAKQGGNEGSTAYGQKLLSHAIESVADALAAKQALALQRAGQNFSAFKKLEGCDLRRLAYIGLRTSIDSLSTEKKFTATAFAIGKRIEDEIKLEAFEAQDKKIFARLMRRAGNSGHYRHRINSITHGMNQQETWEWIGWTQSEKLHAGTLLLGTIIEATGLFHADIVWRKGKEYRTLRATEKTLAWVQRHIDSPICTPAFLPTLIPPKPWTAPTGGGYYHDSMQDIPLVKTYYQTYTEEIANRGEELSTIYTALNAIQDTAWHINGPVLEVAQQLWEMGNGVAGLPPQELLPLPNCPVCGNAVIGQGKHECFERDAEALKRWKQAASHVHQANAKLFSKRLQALKILWVGKRCASQDKIYFPHSVDFRGRIYAMPQYLQPQGCDLAKGLLHFGDGKALGKTGAKWLAIHGANTYGIDKVSFNDRRAWIQEHTQEILACAKSPLDTHFWMEADSPFCFLAFCFEWAGYLSCGEAFVSYLPIALDGSCNGLQHFSAMLRDEVGGSAVNLIPGDTPADIYQTVADRVNVKLASTLAQGTADEIQLAEAWLSLGVTRKTVKRPVMVLPYGGTRYSCRDYLEEAVTEMLEAGESIPWSQGEIFYACLFLSQLVWDAISETLTGATQVMAWLQGLARKTNKASIPLLWHTPSGMPVLQYYPDIASRRVKTHLLGAQVYIPYGEPQPTMDTKRQVSGVSPNFVHSLDASVLVLTVKRTLTLGITHFAMIHDSYGVHASDTEVFSQLIRDAFADMYSTDVLETLRQELSAAVGEELPPAPAKGTLEIDSVRSSLFFFA